MNQQGIAQQDIQAPALPSLTRDQMRVLASAAQLYARMGLGQIEYLVELAREQVITDRNGEAVHFNALAAADDLVVPLKLALTGFRPNASKGIHSEHTPQVAKTAWALYKLMDGLLAGERAAESPTGLPDGTFVGKDADGQWKVIRVKKDGQTVVLSTAPTQDLAISRADWLL